MQDPSLASRILQIAERFVFEARQGCEAYLVIGVRPAAEDEPIPVRWDIVRRGELAQAARQHFERALFELRCRTCGITFELMEGAVACPACGGVLVEVVGARARCPDGAYE